MGGAEWGAYDAVVVGGWGARATSGLLVEDAVDGIELGAVVFVAVRFATVGGTAHFGSVDAHGAGGGYCGAGDTGCSGHDTGVGSWGGE